MGFVFLLSVMTVAYLLESSSADQRLDDGSFDSSLLQDLDHLVIPASTLLGIPQDQDENFTTNEGVLRSALEKRSGRRFRTSAGKEYRLCNPSRHEVLRLLFALHEARLGRNVNKIIELCNRPSSAADVDTNIRFLG